MEKEQSEIALDPNEDPDFTLVRFNPRRHSRRAPAAEVKVEWDDGDTDTLWMSERDLKNNIKEYGPKKGLLDAVEAYKKNVSFP